MFMDAETGAAPRKSFDVSAPWRDKVPIPVFDENPEFVELYWKAWELAHDHMIDLPGMPQTPYMDEAFCDTELWIWDSCFMSLFCKYAPDVFPGVETLDNFYSVLYGGASLPEIITRNAPAWTGHKIGHKAPVRIHIADNPPLFAWAEYENVMMSGDLDRVKSLLLEKRYLQKHYAWIEGLKGPETPRHVSNRTFLVNDGKGYFWEGGRSGMDNTPRGRTGPRAEKERPNNPRMYWIDALAQQGLAALCVSKLAELCGEPSLAAEWRARHAEKTRLVEELYWNSADSCYYDVDCDTLEHIKVLTPASFWPLTARMSSPERAAKIAAHIANPATLGGPVPWLSLARNDADFNAVDGEYWRGALWIPTAYSGLKGLANYGMHELARSSALAILRHMSDTYRGFEPHTIWECYSPSEPKPAMTCGTPRELVRKDFCGWSALGPIGIFIEHAIGIHSVDAFKRRVEWALPAKTSGRTGVRNFRFGGIRADLLYEDGRCQVDSTAPFDLLVDGVAHAIAAGSNSFKIGG